VPTLLETLSRLDIAELLAPEGLLILEHSEKLAASDITITHLAPMDRRSWGDTGVTLFARESATPPTGVEPLA
jgi:hypothetical protein